ncbi:hypothetical protein ACFL5X_00185 [Candidatus Omnitrophota bacterium]
MVNPKFQYYQIQNKFKIPNPKQGKYSLGFGNWDLFGSIGSIWIWDLFGIA